MLQTYDGRRSARPYRTYIRLPHRPHQTTPASKAAAVPDRAGRLGPRPVGRQPRLVRLEPLPGDVRREAVLQEHQAVLGRQPAAPAAPRPPGRLPARVGRPEPVAVGARVHRVAEDVADRLPARGPPVQPPAVGPGLPSHRQPDPVGDQRPQDAVHRPPPVELVEDQADDVLGLLVRVERDLRRSAT